ncbi:MAG: PEP-CTERM sorting domain-containing protein [Candidatus Nealsonbacteria bacterium]|nr:PEP-CTERM sorting domain-containing protein [Candidatus Nealsonbacteria bacterium]
MKNAQVLLAMLVVCCLPATFANGGLVGYWDFDDFSDPNTALDSSGNGNHAAIIEAVYTPDSGGHTGLPGDRAMNFDVLADHAYATVPAAAIGAFNSMTANNAATVSLWIFGAESQPQSNAVFGFFDALDGRQLQAHTPWDNTVIYFDVGGTAEGGQNRIKKFEPDATMWKGQWNHYAFVKNGGTSKIYRNGSLWHSGPTSAPIGPITQVNIGTGQPLDPSYRGLIDDLAVWDEELSADRIQAIFNDDLPLNWPVGGLENIGTLELETVMGDMAPMTGARVIKVIQNSDGPLHLREIDAVQTSTGVNVARTGTASQSSSFGPFPASNVINGNYGEDDFSHTSGGVGEWVKIELDGEKDLDKLTLYNRLGCCYEQARDLQVQVYGDLAETELLFDQQMPGLDEEPYQKDIIPGIGGTAFAALDATFRYQLELNAETVTSDQIVLARAAADSTQLDVGGVLDVILLSGILAEGQQYRLFVADEIVGEFDSVLLPDLPTGLAWDTADLLSNGTISVVPEPSTLLLLSMGAVGLLAYARRRRQ